MENQINIFALKKYKTLFYGILIGVLLSLFFRGCKSSQPQKAIITLKEITKTLPADTIVKHEKLVVKDRSNEKKLSKDVIEMYERLANYQEEIDFMHDVYKYSDSIQQDSIFKLLTEIKKFESNFEDENIKLKINGIVAKNEVKEVTPTYTIKERKIEVPIKSTKFRILGGGGFGINKELNQATWKINTGFQNQKGNVIRGSFQKIGNQDYWLAEYDFSLFKISR